MKQALLAAHKQKTGNSIWYLRWTLQLLYRLEANGDKKMHYKNSTRYRYVEWRYTEIHLHAGKN